MPDLFGSVCLCVFLLSQGNFWEATDEETKVGVGWGIVICLPTWQRNRSSLSHSRHRHQTERWYRWLENGNYDAVSSNRQSSTHSLCFSCLPLIPLEFVTTTAVSRVRRSGWNLKGTGWCLNCDPETNLKPICAQTLQRIDLLSSRLIPFSRTLQLGCLLLERFYYSANR